MEGVRGRNGRIAVPRARTFPPPHQISPSHLSPPPLFPSIRAQRRTATFRMSAFVGWGEVFLPQFDWEGKGGGRMVVKLRWKS
jgi:hypothetical protein